MGGEPESSVLGKEEADLSNYSTATNCSGVMAETLADNGKIVEPCEAGWSSHFD